jgi:hypothetical protein
MPTSWRRVIWGYTRALFKPPSMRLRPILLALLVAAPAGAQTAVDIAAKSLATAKDARIRAQSAVLLGTSKSPRAQAPLCNAMKDDEAIVRAAAARALGDLGDASAATCLKAHANDGNKDVKNAVAKAIEQLTGAGAGLKAGSLYVVLDPIKDETGGLSASDVKLATDLMQKKLTSMGLAVAAPGWDPAATSTMVKSKKLKGWWLKVTVKPNTNNGLKFDLLALTYPDQAIKGSVNVKAPGGPKKEALINAIVPKLIDDASDEFEWTPQ